MLSKRIFLAEDDPDDVEIFQDALLDIGSDATLLVAPDGLQLMDLLNQATLLPDLIFLDLNMPYKNGYLCLREIKADQRLRAIPVVVLTTSSNPQHVAEAYRDGAALFITKPNSYEEFKSQLAHCLRRDWPTTHANDQANGTPRYPDPFRSEA